MVSSSSSVRTCTTYIFLPYHFVEDIKVTYKECPFQVTRDNGTLTHPPELLRLLW
jgi:hypothetical protein